MLSAEQNRQLTQVGPATPMGDLLRRYWHPIAGLSEFDSRNTKPVRLLGEDLVLYKYQSGGFGLIDRFCAHRHADLSYGIVENDGLRCNYHGWLYNASGACIGRPYEEACQGGARGVGNIKIKAYKVAAKAGMLWAYLGPQPAPLLPDWEPFSWPNGFVQIVVSTVPCNWFQCQENSIDPIHFEWMHENWGRRLKGDEGAYGPTHLKLEFEEFDYGFVYKRVRAGGSEQDPSWTIGRVCLWPNAFFLGEHFEWRVPIDDENTLSVTWKFTRVPREQEPYVQKTIPTWEGPVFDDEGRWITSHVMNQDFLAWAGQGRITDRTQEHLGNSDLGIVMIRKRFFEEMKTIAEGGEPKATIRDPGRNLAVELPVGDRAAIIDGHTKAAVLDNPFLRMLATTYVFQAGQPAWVRAEFTEAMGLEVADFTGLPSALAKSSGDV